MAVNSDLMLRDRDQMSTDVDLMLHVAVQMMMDVDQMTTCGVGKAQVSSDLGGVGFVADRGFRLVAQAGEEACYGDVFVEGFPVEASAADADLFPLFRGGV